MATREEIAEINPEALLCDGYEDALLGVAMRFGIHTPVACYDYDKMIAKLVADGMSEEEAEEFFDFNIIGAWAGEHTPIFVRLLPGQDKPSCQQ